MTETSPTAAGGAPVAPEAAPEFTIWRPDKPVVALGLAVNHLMTKPAFANLRFGDWSRILVGQINRRHYAFVVDGAKRIRGFVGWAVTTKPVAEAWVEGRGGLSFEQSRDGNCIVFNAWAADTLAINRFLLDQARTIMQGKDTVYFKRHYKDGTTRPVRLKVNAAVDQHIARKGLSSQVE